MMVHRSIKYRLWAIMYYSYVTKYNNHAKKRPNPKLIKHSKYNNMK